MGYPKMIRFGQLGSELRDRAYLQYELGAKGTEKILRKVEQAIRSGMRELERMEVDKALKACEPDDLAGIRNLRMNGPRRLWGKIDCEVYRDRLAGAFLARSAGCTLGAIVEMWSVEDMERFAGIIGDEFPPVDYWSQAGMPHQLRYGASRAVEYTRGVMKGVPVDDDVAYTLLGLLIVEDFGAGFGTAEVGKAWLKYLPLACTAEHVALENLKKGVSWKQCGVKGNPYLAWIGADIRADPWGYMAPGWPERAAEMAYRDAYVSHRRNGIYGEMFFAATIAAAFAVDHPMEALEIGLTEIPRQCALAEAVRWALKVSPKIRDYRQARAAVDERFNGMSQVHTINNACLTIFGLAIGGTDVTKVLGQTVAMGLDNDCTAATAGSIVGAVVGKRGVPPHWYQPFGNVVHSYLIDRPRFRIADLLKRFERAADTVACVGVKR
ncbi:MAG: ADP-ribosylglycohydrolase family protein [Phycisphaerales bacterium]|nr:ADP-ribosylglycohydrolase family protein [Phycisphaerales bacterium]